MAFPFWQLFLLAQSMRCKGGIVIQTVHDCCVRNEKWPRVWRVIISQNDGIYDIKAVFRAVRESHARGQEECMSHPRLESSRGDARLQTSLQTSLCSAWPEHHVKSQLWWMFHPAVSLTPLFTCIYLSPVATRLTSLPAAVTAQCFCLLRAGGQSWSHPPVHSSTQQGCKPLLRHNQQFSPQSWRREAGGCTSVPHAEFMLVAHRQPLLSLTGYFLQVKKKSRESSSP